LDKLRSFLAGKKALLQVIEIAGKGSPYAFADKSKRQQSAWQVLFPNHGMEEIPVKTAARALWQALENHQPDVVLAGAVAFPSGATAVQWARKRKKPVIIFDDARLADVPRSGLVNWVKKKIYANVDAVFIPAPSHAGDFAFWGFPEHRMFYGLNVVDNAFFTRRAGALKNEKARIFREFGLPGKFFLGVGRQIRKKNWPVLLEAYAFVKDGDPSWGLVLVGDGPERAKIERTVRDRNLTNVRLIPFLDQKKLCEIYSQAACMVLPSLYAETWGLVVNEAMACSVPVMVSKTCGCAQTLVREGRNGWTFDPHSPDQLSQRLHQFMALSEAQRQDMGRSSLDIISDWGLDRFCKGIWEAVTFCQQSFPRQKTVPVIDSIILNLWKGRYRPV
jgi:glycosyltransferase involved in cell wall biosynthesis